MCVRVWVCGGNRCKLLNEIPIYKLVNFYLSELTEKFAKTGVPNFFFFFFFCKYR